MEPGTQSQSSSNRFAVLGSSYARVAIGMLLILIGYLALFSYFGSSNTDRMYETRRQELQRLVYFGLNVLQPVIEQEKRGEISQDQAIAAGRDLIRRMTYLYGRDNSLGANYLFMIGYDGTVLVQSLKPDQEGTNQLDQVAANNQLIVRDMLQKATSPGVGYVESLNVPPGGDQPQTQISYVIGIPELKSFIGSSMFMTDIDQDSQTNVRNALLLTGALFVLILVAIFFILRPIFSSYNALLKLFVQVIRNPDASLIVPAESYPPGTEGRQLLSGFRDMLGQIRQSKQQLQISEDRFNLAMQGTNDGIWDWEIKTNSVYYSPRWKSMLGYEDHELPNRFEEWTTRIHPDDIDRVMATLNAHLAGETPYYEVEHRVQHKDGTYRWILARGASVRDESGRPYRMAGSHTDITERKRVAAVMQEREEQYRKTLEQRVEERTRELSTLLEITHNMTSTLELKPLLRLILNQMRSVVDYNGATIFTLNDEELTILDYKGPLAQDSLMRLRFPLARAGANQEVIRRREPIVIDDVRGDSPIARAFQQFAGDQLTTTFGYIRSWMGVPLIANERVIGMLSLDSSEPNYYTERHAQLALAIASQAAIAIENSRLYWQGKELAALEERQRLARELHDSVSQALYGIALGARTARAQLEREPARAAEPLDYVLQLAEAGLAEMRALIFELRPESLKTDGLVEALTKQAAAVRARHQMEVQLELCDEPDIPLEAKEALYRIAQEGMHNIVKHAHATRIDLKLSCDGGQVVTLEIKDNGVGFDSQGTYPGHLGLRSMRERAIRLGGGFSIKSEPGQGTRIRARIPVSNS